MLSWIPQRIAHSVHLYDDVLNKVVGILLEAKAESCYIHKPDLYARAAAQQTAGEYYAIILSEPPVVLPPEAHLLTARGLLLQHFGIEWAPTYEQKRAEVPTVPVLWDTRTPECSSGAHDVAAGADGA